ncbi:2-hydroxycarboxylate transporter family protein [Paenibacillus sp. FSL R7-0331]|uniref:2-hydroxycarboxylate transporter family protein n=1 Tax=Paenibacillus sp. FSL R7-0331 TaxID=1536773 RepID=UPI0004F5DA09|nr:2-hydroxycarboxylate transporter family protein [Paenibacillus sp. FSL R7-0331]AIQ51420.1 malate permease [Paenibacillus sp. FSL R7-0331]
MQKVFQAPLPVPDQQHARKQEKNGFVQRVMQLKVGVIPLPLYVVFALIIFAASVLGELPNDMIGGFAVIIVLGVLLSDLGFKLPVLKNIGGPAILSLMIPSFLVFWNVLDPSVTESVNTLMKTSNFLYLYISVLVAGSITGMNRTTLISGFIRIFIPMMAGTLVAVGAGLGVGMLLGYSAHRTLFYIIVPIIGGGVGEGILPLSIAFSQILGGESGSYVAQMIPAAVIGNVFAIIGAGLLKKMADKNPSITGNGVLVKSKDGRVLGGSTYDSEKPDFLLMGAGLLFACGLFITGHLLSPFIGIPGPILMIFTAALLKILKLLPSKIEQGAYQLYKLVSGTLTWPLMVGLGMLYIPLEDVAALISIPYIIVCATVIAAMILTGYFIGKWINMYPVEAAIVTGCRGGLGGTGDVAILSASGRMELMPFAQISTRIGGAITVVAATLLISVWGG